MTIYVIKMIKMKKIMMLLMILITLMVIPMGNHVVEASEADSNDAVIEQLSTSLAELGDTIIQLSFGHSFSSALTGGGRVFMWGHNYFGQLGDGTYGIDNGKLVPTEITDKFPSGDKVIQLSMGNNHSSAVTENGQVFTWGYNNQGQLGDETILLAQVPTNITEKFSGIEVDDKVIQLSLGIDYSAALTVKGKVFTWGKNDFGQLGDKTKVNKTAPTEITGNFLNIVEDDKIIQLSMGGNHSSALTQNGQVYTWGSNISYQLSQGAISDNSSPTNITDNFKAIIDAETKTLSEIGDKVIQLSMGMHHSSALTQNGRVYTWGSNSNGQLGDNTISPRQIPTNITDRFPSGDKVVNLSMANVQSSAVTENGQVFTWGYNFYYQLGLGSASQSNRLVPTNVTNPFVDLSADKVIQLSMGAFHSAALTGNGQVFTWGYNGNGQLGDSTIATKTIPNSITSYFVSEGVTISFSSNGGTGVSSINAEPGDPVSEPTAPARAGYTFAGWYSDSALTSAYTFSTMPNENMTLYAKWNVVIYDIFYNIDGGINHSSNPSTYNIETVTILLEDATKTGYTFSGWYENNLFTDKSQVSEITQGSTGNTELYAKWLINSYTITFESNGGSSVSAITQEYDSNLIAPSSPTKTDLIFAGWYLDPSLTQSYTFDKMSAENMTLYAKFVLNEFTATFKDHDGTTISTSTVNYLASADAPSSPSRTGYTFSGWDVAFNSMTADIDVIATYSINQYSATFKDYDGTTIATSTVNYLTGATAPASPNRTGYTFSGWDVAFNSMTANINVSATYSINQYSATFKDHDGRVITTSTVNYLASAEAPASPTRTGYTFSGWDVNFNSMTDNIDVIAIYSISQYSATFKDHDGTTLSTSTVNYLASADAPSSPTRTGYTFSGWDVNFNSMTANIDITATYTINSFTATFKDHDGRVITTSTVNYLASAEAPASPSRTGYTFSGWDVAFNSMTADIDVIATYSINQYSATFKDHDGTTIATSTVDYLTGAIAPASPNRTGYTFNGWDVAFNSMTADINVSATYTINQYTATFKDHDGTTIATSTVNYLASAEAPASPSRTGYTFSGWDVAFNSMTADIDVIATYSINQYSATFKDYDGTTIATSTVNYLTGATAPVSPSRAGYTFNGWDTLFNSMTADIDVSATYSINQYTVSFNTNGGSEISSLVQSYNTVIILPEDPTREGYIFNGWCQTLPDIMPAEDMVLNARWLKETQQSEDFDTIVDGLIDGIDQSLYEGKDAEIILQVEQRTASEINETESTGISLFSSENLEIRKLGIIYLNISVLIKFQDSPDEIVNQLTQKITITLIIPIEQQGYESYHVIRVHEGIAEVIDSVYDEEEQTLIFETDRFSTYAIVYESSNASNLWWFTLLLLLPVGYFGYRYRAIIKEKTVFIFKKIKLNNHKN